MDKKIVYIAGPMRGIPLYNFPAFDAAEARLKKRGWIVINPAELDRKNGVHENTDPLPDGFLRNAMLRDTGAICTADAIALLPGWHASKGAAVELALAKLLGLEILDAVTCEPYSEPITDEAFRITSRDRRDVYGHPLEDFERIAKMWSGVVGANLTAEQVGACMILLKVGRLCHSPGHRDSLVDIAGYANCLDLIRQRRGHVVAAKYAAPVPT